MDFEHSPRAVELQARLSAFMHRHVYPVEALYQEQVENGHRHHRPPVLEELKKFSPEERVKRRIEKFGTMGFWEEVM